MTDQLDMLLELTEPAIWDTLTTSEREIVEDCLEMLTNHGEIPYEVGMHLDVLYSERVQLPQCEGYDEE